MITFTQPLFLWGLLLVGVPIWIHFKGVRQSKAIHIPSLMWLNTISPSDAKKNRIKDIIVLILRVLFVFFVVITLANPKRETKIFDLQIDNYPSAWTAREQWLLPMLNTLSEGTYNLYDREGTFLGTHSKDAIPALIRRLNSTTNTLTCTRDAKLLSFGFADLGQPLDVLLPNRSILQNRKLSLVSNSVSGWKIDLDTISPIRIIEKGIIIEQAEDSVYDVLHSILSSKDTVYFESDLDSVPEDNVIHFFPLNQARTAIIYAENTKRPSGEFIGDSLIIYRSGISLDPSLFQAVVLVGFDYLPSVFKDYQGKLARFKVNRSSSLKGSSIPQVSQEFFQSYFIGPSLNNRWPTFYEDQHLGPAKSTSLLVDFDGNSLANLDRNRYEQAFTPMSWNHPFYNALGQWLNQTNAKIKYIPYLGRDYYSRNILAKGATIMDNMDSLELGSSVSILTPSRLCLVLALFCAVLALIFVKI